MSKTAAELMAELGNNEKYTSKKREKNEKLTKLEEIYAQDEKDLIKELNQAGYSVNSVWEFVNSENYYLDAAPILIKHLRIDHHPKILAGIARSLAIPELLYNTELWGLLVSLYDKTEPDSKINTPEYRGAQEAIAVALECLAVSSEADILKKLIDRNLNGDGIHWLQDKLKKLVQK